MRLDPRGFRCEAAFPKLHCGDSAFFSFTPLRGSATKKALSPSLGIVRLRVRAGSIGLASKRRTGFSEADIVRQFFFGCMVASLLSDDSSRVNAQNIEVAGGDLV